jgi:WD40 repeat protein
VAFGRDGKSVRTCTDMIGPGVVAWDTADGKDRGAFRVPVGSNVRPAFSADGSLVTSADEANVFRVWDTATGTLQLQLPKHKDKVYGAAFSPDGRYLATGGRTNPVHLWELATGGLVRTLPAAGDHVFAFTPDGRALVSAGDSGTAHVWDLATGKDLRRFRGPWRPRALALSHDGRTVAAAGQEGVIGLWDFASGKPKVPAAESPAGLVPLAFLPGGKSLAVGWGAGLAVWQIDGPPRQGHRLETIDRPLALSADGKLALAGPSYQGLNLWDVEAGVELCKFGERDHRAWAAFAPDGKTLALVASGEAALWDVNTGKAVRRLGKPRSFRGSVAFSPDGKVLAMLGEAESVLRFWETATGKLQKQVDVPVERGRHWYNSSLTFTPDGRVLAVADWNGARLFDVAAGRFTHKLPTGVVAFSPDGKVIAGGGHDGVTRLWEVATGKPAGELHGHEGRVTGLRFSPDGRLLASGAADHTVLLWDVRRAK